MAIKKNTNDLLSQAATTLADNSTQDISPQDIREMAENNAFSSYNKITDNNLVGLKNYSTAATYEAAQGVVYNGSIYISNTIPTPGAFNASEWDILVGGEINTSSNSGTGEGLALAKSGSDLPFKSLTAGTGITLTSAANELQISSAGGTDTNIGNTNLTLAGNRDIDSNGNTLLISNGTKNVGIPSWSTHTFWGLDNGNDTRWDLLSANTSGVMNAGEFGITKDGSGIVPFRIFNGNNITLGHIAKANLDTNYSVNIADGLLIKNGNFKLAKVGTGSQTFTIETKVNQEIRTTTNSYPAFYFDNGTTNYLMGNADASSGTVNEGDFFIYNASTVKTNLLITKTGKTIISNGATAVVGNEGISLQDDTLIKGSDNAEATSGLKVTDVNNLSLLEVRNNGFLKLQYLPSLPAGTVAGDVWSQNGTLKIGNPTANIQTEVSASTITPNIDTTKLIVTSALAAALTIAAPTGTPHEGQELTFRFKDDGTARALTWNAIFEDYTGSLPTTTTAGKTVYIGCKYNLINTKWDVVAVQNQP